MTESIYKEFENKYYNPDDNDKRPGDNDNWKSIQEGFSKISTTQLETSKGLTLGKGTEDETSVTAAELGEMKQGGPKPLYSFHTIQRTSALTVGTPTYGSILIGGSYVYGYAVPGQKYAVIAIPCSVDSGSAAVKNAAIHLSVETNDRILTATEEGKLPTGKIYNTVVPYEDIPANTFSRQVFVIYIPVD